ncbi:hypothetical protein [Streptosporangium carneum]|uniref:Uncharacterized protein n=1 Tax=Streptosporangium carneum TaxID=47481 RepID=A0A9W6HZV6_9ACTN|nr:hypothetical protein [Streptosporangium carneum]GLK08405.1 hypothetical protein GCM10017600_18100 [Streptosporangium carneum]
MTKEVLLPLGVILICTVGVTVAFVLSARLHRAAMAEYREAVDRMAKRQDQVGAQLAELTGRVAEVERILRSVG